MWPSVNGNVLTNQIDIRSEKTHEVTRCKQALSLRGVLTFVASGLDINGCVLSYFEGTANLHCYTSCTLTTLHCSKVSFLQCCHMKRYNKIFTKMWGVYSLLWDTFCACVCLYIYIYIYISAVKRLITSKIKVFVYIIYVWVLCIFIVYINTHTRMYIFKKNMLFIDKIFIYNINLYI